MGVSRYLCVTSLLFLVPIVMPTQGFTQVGEHVTDCQNATTTASMRACETARYEKAAQELTAVYTDLTKKSGPATRQKLAAAQSAWVRFRNANAILHASEGRGGTVSEVIKMSVLADMTEARVAELKKMR